MPIDEAVKKAVDDCCIKEDILKEFLLRNKTEMIQVSIFEYDEEQHKKFIRQEGKAEGKAESIIDILEDLGTVPTGLKESILSETDAETLRKWTKLAARVGSVEEFINTAQILVSVKS